MESFDIKNFDPQKSLFIEASAGTGKTYTIQLMVSKLISLGTPLKKILIVTYTEKAAGELKDRIRKKINEVLEYKKINKDDENEKELSKEILGAFAKANQDVDNAAIFTIHSFCQKALKEYAYDAGRPFDMGMVDESEVADLVEQLIRDEWVNEPDFQRILQAESTFSLVSHLKDAFVGAINSYKGSNKSGEIIPLDSPTLPEINGNTIPLNILEKLTQAKDFNDLKVIPGFDEELTVFEKAKGTENRAEDFVNEIKSWQGITSELFNGRSFQARYFSDSFKSHFEAIKNIKDFLHDIGSEYTRVLYEEFICKRIPVIFDRWQKIKKDNKTQSFNDMILSVHKAITAGDNLKEKLRQQYSYAIIDEFQDTNKLQWDIFRTVFLKDNNKAVKDHSIFVVGDPKQSIYSFQGADVNVYKEATEEIRNGSSLNNNFRSTTGIIEGCNELFKGSFFTPAEGSPELVKFQPSGSPANENQVKVPPMINGKEVAPIWISEDEISSLDFARTVVSKIVDWCSFENEQTKLQVFDKKNCRKYHNVSFRDFAVLARTRTEMEIIEDALRSAGVPFSRYKDSNLFKGRECAEWIALFRALNASDFSAWNRRLLSEVLITDFFKTIFTKKSSNSEIDHSMDELHYVDSKIFDDPNNPQRKLLNDWRNLALKRRYAEMLERIYSDTQIEQRLMDISKLQNLAKLRQIGNYAIEFLYSHNCSLEDLVRHLEGLAASREDADDEDGNLVEKGTDYDAVQIMTIHASKGLEFPVVISVAGFKGVNKAAKGPYLYHGEDGIHLGLSPDAKERRRAEELEEWKRLFYVDFTRASSILILPRYEKWTKKDKSGAITSVRTEFQFLYDSHKEFCEKSLYVKNQGEKKLTYPCYTVLGKDSQWEASEKKTLVKDFILQPLSKKDTNIESIGEVEAGIQNQKLAMADLQRRIPGACIMQYSYSSLSGKADNGITNEDNTPIDQNGDEDRDTTTKAKVSIKSIDVNAVDCSMAHDESRDYQSHYEESACRFPRGSKLGNAIHHLFERTRFQEFGALLPNLESALREPKYVNMVEEEFRNEALPIWKHKEQWTSIAISYLWNTLQATLPVIEGCAATSETFSLVDIPLTDHKAEMQFNLNAHDEHSGKADSNGEAVQALRRFCKGFIDLMFVRTDAQGNKRYSILDWKSDVMEENNYTPAALKERVDADYSIQRVLYSYCLIQWLKQFYGAGTAENLTEEEIFNKHFGGIYYAFVRGTQGGTGKGIYAQTWNSYEDLKQAFGEVKKLMSK